MQNRKIKYINSCFNYTGSKYKQLPQLFKLFPKYTDTFVDLFCGGGVVGVNALSQMNAKKVILNDKSSAVISIFNYLKSSSYDEVIKDIYHISKDYGLSDTSKHGYAYYGVDSSTGLSQVNKKGFLALRTAYNQYLVGFKYSKEALLYALIIFSFNNQIRFNQKNQFNLPVGKRDFNQNMKKKLAAFIEILSNPEIQVSNIDFTEIHPSKGSFVYCDPPYSITTATYNERSLWTKEDDTRLFKYLDELDSQNIRFALSNVFEHNGVSNDQLKRWSRKYNVHAIEFNYNNSNYHSKAKQHKTQEVLITNYED